MTTIVLASAATDLVVDVYGHFAPGPSVAPLAGARVLESRAGFATVDGLSNAIGKRAAGSVTELLVSGRAGVASRATAVVLTVTVTGAEQSGFVTVFPCSLARPNTSNVNYAAGQTIGNSVIINLGTDTTEGPGPICIYTQATTHLVIDLTSHFLT